MVPNFCQRFGFLWIPGMPHLYLAGGTRKVRGLCGDINTRLVIHLFSQLRSDFLGTLLTSQGLQIGLIALLVNQINLLLWNIRHRNSGFGLRQKTSYGGIDLRINSNV